MAQFDFIGGSSTARSKNFDAQESLNLYAEIGSGNSKSPAMLVGTPGMAGWQTLAASLNTGVRGLYRFNDQIAIAVMIDYVWIVYPDGGAPALLLGPIASATTPVSMADNGSLVMMVTGSAGYFIDPVAATITQITDADFVGGDKVGFLAGRFIWNKPGTGQFQWTELYGTNIDSLSFSTAEASPDVIVSQIVGFGELWEFGVNSTEVFQPSGDADTPFVKVQGAAMEIGCAAKNSVAKIDSSFLWLGRSDEGSGVIWRSINYQPQRISTHAIEFAIAGYSRIDDAEAFTYQQEGHSFYVLSFPTANVTWCYDVSTGLWHQRGWRNPTSGLLERARPNCQMQFNGETVVGDRNSNTLCYLQLDTYLDVLDTIVRRRAAKHISNDLRRVFYNSFQLDFESGVGIPEASGGSTPVVGSDPQAMLDWSDDGGHTWSNEHWASIGKIGQYRRRVKWRRLGTSRDRIFRVTISDPVKVVIVGASLEAVARSA
jgi:hypothetical protein